MPTAEQFSQEELLEHAQGNVTGFVLTSIAYVKQQGHSVEDWSTFVGRCF